MIDNSLEQSQSVKEKYRTSPNVRTEIRAETRPDSQKTVLCPNCNSELPEEALFCPECGSPINQHLCPKCGAPASPTADICQSCGAWLLKGKCKFCYADLSSDEAMFCPECGKPKDGIPCPHCGKISIFDFCSSCGKPVTEEALAEVKRAQDEITNESLSAVQEGGAVQETQGKTFGSNQEARRWFNAQRLAAEAQTGKIEAELAELEAFINSDPEPEKTEYEIPAPRRKSLFSDSQLASIRKTGAAIDAAVQQRAEEARIAEEKRKAEEAERKRKEEERRRQLKEAQERREALERALRPRAWRCNAYGVTHPGGPNECCDPSMGGQWV